jgi:hypothetical protein
MVTLVMYVLQQYWEGEGWSGSKCFFLNMIDSFSAGAMSLECYGLSFAFFAPEAARDEQYSATSAASLIPPDYTAVVLLYAF